MKVEYKDRTEETNMVHLGMACRVYTHRHSNS